MTFFTYTLIFFIITEERVILIEHVVHSTKLTIPGADIIVCNLPRKYKI